MKKLFLVILLSLFASNAMAAMPVNPSYVAPGAAIYPTAACTNADPCSLAYALANAIGDNVVILKDGTYTTMIDPSNSGTAGHMITFQAANKWAAIIGNTSPFTTNRQAAMWIGKDYIKIDGIKFDATQFSQSGPNNLLLINNGADHVEITNCWFYGPAFMQTYSSTHIWFHGNTVQDNNAISAECDDSAYGLQLGAPGSTLGGVVGNNTVEDNIFIHGGHHNVENFTVYNVVRNNFFYNEGNMTDPTGCTPGPDSNGKYGNRNLSIDLDSHVNFDGAYMLIEGNRIGPSGSPPDDTGWGGEGISILAEKVIFRYNSIYSANNSGLSMKTGSTSASDNDRIYNNTIVGSGRWQQTNFTWQGGNIAWYGNYTRTGNVIKNNLLYSYGTGGADWIDGSGDNWNPTNNTVTNNFCTDAAAGKCSANGNPLFIDGTLPAITSTPNQTQPNLALQSTSPAINGGVALTTVAAADTSSGTSLVLTDALYFQAGSAAATTPMGSSLSNVQGDWILVGATVAAAQATQITDLNYTTNTATINPAITRSDGDSVWLYKKSDGTQVLYGSAPDYGASEWFPTGDVSGATISGATIQ